MKTYSDLQELTGHESGVIQYSYGEIWIGNWTGVSGIPRQFISLPGSPMIGLGETLTAKRCAAPKAVIKTMQQHERDNGDTVSTTGFRAWEVNGDTSIVVQADWV